MGSPIKKFFIVLLLLFLLINRLIYFRVENSVCKFQVKNRKDCIPEERLVQ